jgi:hypothetical protein
MKIAIISDSHDNLATMEKFIAFFKKEKLGAIVHCGDISSGETLAILADKTQTDIVAALGNADDPWDLAATIKKRPRVRLFKGLGSAEIGGLRLGFCHYKEMGARNCGKNRFDFIFYGHSHMPWMEEINGSILANPGNLAGMIYKASFAVLDTGSKRLDLKIVDRLQH